MNGYQQKMSHPAQTGVGDSMTIRNITDLSWKDIKFLTAVRDINENPDQYSGTARGVAAANTTSLREATELSRGEIRHRLNEKSDIADRGLGILRLHDPQLTEKGDHGPKSVELTEFGERVLDRALAARGVGDADPVEVAKGNRLSVLEQRLDEVEETVEELRETVQNLAAEVRKPQISMSEFVFDDPHDGPDTEGDG